jgi:hypothetical protein
MMPIESRTCLVWVVFPKKATPEIGASPAATSSLSAAASFGRSIGLFGCDIEPLLAVATHALPDICVVRTRDSFAFDMPTMPYV